MTDGTNEPSASGGSVEVRRLVAPQRNEIEQLATIFDRYRAHYGETADASQTASWLEKNISRGHLDAFVAEDNGEYIGFGITTSIPASLRLSHFWQIRDLFVVPPYRRLGVGGALLDLIRATAIATGALRLSLQTEVDNTSALRLYAQRGYTIVEGYCSLSLSLTSD